MNIYLCIAASVFICEPAYLPAPSTVYELRCGNEFVAPPACLTFTFGSECLLLVGSPSSEAENSILCLLLLDQSFGLSDA
jgi:hypothetical protein